MSSVVQKNFIANNLLNPLALTILASFLVFLIFKRRLINLIANRKIRLPPSPTKLPIVGNLLQLGLSPHRSLRSLAQSYGPMMLLQLGEVPVLVVSSADAACEIMKTQDLQFATRPRVKMADKLLYNSKDIAFSPYGEYWRQVRSICVMHLLSYRRVQSFCHVREEETALLIDRIRQASLSSLPVDLTEMFVTITNDVVCRVALGGKYSGGGGDYSLKFKVLLREFGELLGTFVVGDYIPWLAWLSRVNGLDARAERVAEELDEFLDGVIEKHISRGTSENIELEEKSDFVDVLLWIQKTKALGFPIDRVVIKALILDMFAAGTDTTYTVLEWAMTELLRHPKIMKKLQDEVRSVAGGKSHITQEDLEGMPYLKAVLKEALRLHAPVPLLVPRVSRENVKVKGYDVLPGTQVIINAWAIGRDPLSWEQPEMFQPERFSNNDIDFKGHDFQFIPFGSGRRGCPGMQFAMALNELVLANIVNQFDWSLPGGAAVEDLDIEESSGLSIHRKNPLVLVPMPFYN
uniref:Cytochrome P450 oxidase CYP71AU93 n=1 Tax=Polygala tenuifolia TaxID=355332 RepID=A0A3G5ANG2_9FABA|nr:cytochrome P450 oxidase CYP71AU93 [Polygala tenuifolia]